MHENLKLLCAVDDWGNPVRPGRCNEDAEPEDTPSVVAGEATPKRWWRALLGPLADWFGL